MFLNYKIHKFYILLGTLCNFKCLYCIQENNKKVQFPIKINEKLIEFLKEKSTKDFTQDIVFYGGEPLIYFEQIKEIVNQTKEFNLRYQILTNGSLITDEIIEFCNKNNIQVMLSWDGKNSKTLRGKDSIKDNEKVLLIDKLIINPVFTNISYPLDILKELENINEIRKSLFLKNNINCYSKLEMVGSPLYPSNEHLVQYLITDYNKLEKDSEKIIELALSDKESIYFEYLIRMLREFEINQKSGLKNRLNQCSTGYKVFNLDLNGNIYACHNYTAKVGDLNSDLFDILDNVNKFIKPITDCKNCTCKDYCLISCNIYLSNSKYKEYFCNFQKSFLKPFMKFVYNFNKEKI